MLSAYNMAKTFSMSLKSCDETIRDDEHANSTYPSLHYCKRGQVSKCHVWRQFGTKHLNPRWSIHSISVNIT